MITKLQMPTLAPTWKGAKVAYFDCYQVVRGYSTVTSFDKIWMDVLLTIYPCLQILDAINNPKQYLDHPYNTTGFDHQCADAECANSYLYAPNDYNGYFWSVVNIFDAQLLFILRGCVLTLMTFNQV